MLLIADIRVAFAMMAAVTEVWMCSTGFLERLLDGAVLFDAWYVLGMAT